MPKDSRSYKPSYLEGFFRIQRAGSKKGNNYEKYLPKLLPVSGNSRTFAVRKVQIALAAAINSLKKNALGSSPGGGSLFVCIYPNNA